MMNFTTCFSGRKTAVALLAAACTGISTLAVAQVEGGQIEGENALRAIIENSSSVPFLNLSVGAVDSEGDQLTVSDLVMTFEIPLPGGEITGDHMLETLAFRARMPEAVFVGLREEGERFAADLFQADRLEISLDAPSLVAPDLAVVYEGYSMLNLDWARYPEVENSPDAPVSSFYPLIEALVDFDFDAAIIKSMSMDLPTEDGGELSYRFGKTVIGKTVAGNISRRDSDVIKIAIKNEAKGIDVSGEIGPLVTVDYNIGDLVRAFAPGAAPSSEYRPVYGRFEMEGFHFSGTGQKGSIDFQMGKTVAHDVGVRTPSVPLLSRLDALVASTLSDPEFKPDDREITELILEFDRSLRLGDLELAGFRVSVDGDEVTSIGSMGIRDLSADGLGGFFMRQADFEPQKDAGRVHIDDLSIEGLGFPPLAAFMALTEAEDEPDPAALLAAMPTLDHVEASGVDVDTPEVEFSVGHYLIDHRNYIGAIPTAFTVAIDAFDLPTARMEADAREGFEALGYDHLQASLHLAGQWSEDTSTVVFTGDGNLVDGGSFALNATLGGITRQLFEDPVLYGPATALGVTLTEAALTVQDDLLRERVIASVAEDQGVEPEAVRQMAMGMVPFLLAQLERPEFSRMATAAFKTFLEGEGRMVISATPDMPLPLTSVIMAAQSNPGFLVDTLKPVVEAE